MPKYESEGTKQVTLTQTTFSESARAAAKQFFEEHRQFPETVCEVSEDEDAEPFCHEVATGCEHCLEAVFVGEEYYVGEDYNVCKECGDTADAPDNKLQLLNSG